jgi:hypothetical protein
MLRTRPAPRSAAFPALLPALAALLLAACSGGGDGAEPVIRERGVDAFHSIDFRGAGRLDVLVGPRQSVVVETGAKSQDDVTTTVRNGTLVVETRDGAFWQAGRGDLQLRVTLPKLNALALNGAGNLTLNGMTGGELVIVVAGAGNLEAGGEVKTLTVRVNGAGNADLQRLVAQEAYVTLNGAGTVELHATQRLDATVNGVGSIQYLGQPAQLNTQLNGIGRIGPLGGD